MALDTTVGGATADSYAELDDFKAYADAIGFVYSGFSDAQIEVAMRNATIYLDRAYADRWIGVRVDETQDLEWPREDVAGSYLYDANNFEIGEAEIPTGVIKAQYEATILILGGTNLLPNHIADQSVAGKVSKTRLKAGPVESETEYSDQVAQPFFNRISTIEGLLNGLVTSNIGVNSGQTSIGRG